MQEQSRPGRKKWIVIVVVLLLLCGAATWTAKELFTKGEVEVPLPDSVAQGVADTLNLGEERKLGPVRFGGQSAGTGGGSGQTAAVPSMPEIVLPDGAPQSQTGDAAGQTDIPPQTDVQRALVIPGVNNPAASSNDSSDVEPQTIRARAAASQGQDAVVSLAFIQDAAAYLAQNYWPAGTHPMAVRGGMSTAGARELNMRYGVRLQGLGGNAATVDFHSARASVLSYLFIPGTLRTVTDLYAERFAVALADEGMKSQTLADGTTKRLTKAQTADMLIYYANYARSVGDALHAYAAQSAVSDALRAYTQAQEDFYTANMRYLDAQQNLTLAEDRQDGSGKEALEEAAKLERRYRQAVQKKDAAAKTVTALLAQGNARRLDSGTLLFLAAWANRRGENAKSELLCANRSAEQLARTLEAMAAEL